MWPCCQGVCIGADLRVQGPRWAGAWLAHGYSHQVSLPTAACVSSDTFRVRSQAWYSLPHMQCHELALRLQNGAYEQASKRPAAGMHNWAGWDTHLGCEGSSLAVSSRLHCGSLAANKRCYRDA